MPTTKKDRAVGTLLESLGAPVDSIAYRPDIYRLSAETILWIANKVEALKPTPVAAGKAGEATQATQATSTV